MNSQAVTFSITDLVGVLWRRKFRILLVGLIGMGVATYIAFQIPLSYVAQGQVVVRSAGAVASDPDHSFYSSVVSDAVIATERDVMAATGLASRIAGSVQLPQPTQPAWRTKVQDVWAKLVFILHLPGSWSAHEAPAPLTEEAKIGFIQRALSTAADKGSSVINVTASTRDAALSSEIVNNALTFYMDDRVVAQRTSARNVENALRDRLQQTNSEIARVEGNVAGLMRQPGMIENAEVPNTARELTLMGGRLAAARADLAAKRAAATSASRLQDSARGNPRELIELLDQGQASTAALRSQFAQAQEEVNRLRSDVGPMHPRALAAQTALNGLSAGLSSEARRIVAQRQADATASEQVVASLAKQYEEMQQKTSQIGPSVMNVDREREGLSNLRKISGTIEDRLIAITAQPLDPNAQVLTWASVPSQPAGPHKAIFSVGGLLLGVFSAAGFTLLREYKARLRPTVSHPAEILAGRMLGSIPELRGRRLTDNAAMIFQGIAIEVDNAALENGFRVLAITSGVPNEGKTTVAGHLGLALSRLGRRVLIVNCDLHQNPGDGRVDLTDSHNDGRSLPGVVIPDGTNLHVIPFLGNRGDDAVTYLRSARFEKMLNVARNSYDIVLCDTPPILSVPDAAVVARASDAVLLVSAYDNDVSEPMAGEISRRIAGTGRPLCGVIVTKTNGHDATYTSYAGYARRRHAASIMGAIAADRTP